MAAVFVTRQFRKQRLGWPCACDPDGEYPLYTYTVQFLHLGLVMPLLGLTLVLAPGYHDAASREELEPLALFCAQHIHYSMVGNMAYQMLDRRHDVFFTLHHAFCIAGCILCHNFPGCYGAVARNVALAEHASFWYNLKCVCPSMATSLLYIVSEQCIDWFLLIFWFFGLDAKMPEDASAWMKLCYKVLGLGLFVFRFCGMGLSCKEMYEHHRRRSVLKEE
jgi:hypothetical protein